TEDAFPIRQHTMLAAAVVGAEHPHTTYQNRHFRSGESHQLGTIQHELLSGNPVILFQPVTIAIVNWLQHLKGVYIGHLSGSITTPRCERHSNVNTGVTSRFFHCGRTTKDNQISDADLFAESGLELLQHAEH